MGYMATLCSACNSATSEARAHGWCNACYKRWRRHGDPLGGRRSPRNRTPAKPGEPLAYLLMHYQDDTDECIIWPFSNRGKHGYITFRRPDGQWESIGAHVLACLATYGQAPDPSMEVAHAPVICHNPLCFNGRHVRWDTRKGNLADKQLDGTDFSGDRHPNAVLTWEKVDAIRARYASGGITMTALGIEYGVTLSNISCIIRGKTWLRTDAAA